MEVKVFDNVTEIVRDDMAVTISKGSKVSMKRAPHDRVPHIRIPLRKLTSLFENVEKIR